MLAKNYSIMYLATNGNSLVDFHFMLVCTCNPFLLVQRIVSFRLDAMNFLAYKLISISQNSVYTA